MEGNKGKMMEKPTISKKIVRKTTPKTDFDFVVTKFI